MQEDQMSWQDVAFVAALMIGMALVIWAGS